MEPHVLRKYKHNIIFLILLSLICIPIFSDTKQTTTYYISEKNLPLKDKAIGKPFWENRKNVEEIAESLIDSMSIEEILGQIFFLGYIGKKPSDEIKMWIKQRNLGGVKIFTRNVRDLENLSASIKEMQEIAVSNRYGIPLLVATDQEGGWVRHIKHETSVTPGNLALGAERNPTDAFKTGYYIGLELKTLGINMNFAPTADVYSNPKASVIGPRAFSSDPVETGLLSSAYFKGMEKAGIICTAKHFPGHGDANKDSHGFLPVINSNLKTLWERDLLPYRFLIKEGLPAIMSGHLAFPKISGKDIPSSLSPLFQREILREKLHFKGIVVTDDMEMGGILRSGLTTPEGCKKAIEAGNDMVLISHSPPVQEKTWHYLLKAAERDNRFFKIVKEAAKRVIVIKLKYLRDFPLLPDYIDIAKKIRPKDSDKFFFNAACRSVTTVRNKEIPFVLKTGERIILIGQFREFLQEGKRRIPQADTYYYPFSPFYHARSETIYYIKQLIRDYDTIIFCLANFNSMDVLESIRDSGKKIIVISSLTPVYLNYLDWVKTAIAVYGMGEDSFRAGFGALMGDFKPQGILPIKF